LDPILRDFETIAKSVKKYSKPCCTFVSSVTGEIEQDFGFRYWLNQTRNRVKWTITCEKLVESADIFLDMGAHPILNQLLTTNIQKPVQDRILILPSIRRDKPSWETFTTSLATLYSMGVDINWCRYHRFLPGNIVDLPHYPWQREKHWFTVNKTNKQSNQFRKEKMEFPLIGSMFPTPVSNIVIYVNYLSLKNTPYVADHEVSFQ
jgi:acyl transferase domain-containing protein